MNNIKVKSIKVQIVWEDPEGKEQEATPVDWKLEDCLELVVDFQMERPIVHNHNGERTQTGIIFAMTAKRREVPIVLEKGNTSTVEAFEAAGFKRL